MHRLALAVSGFLAVVATSTAQDVAWRTDYAAARSEAQATGRPMLFNFTTSWCLHCRRLDADTFRSPQVAPLLAQDFIPVKLDGDLESRLVSELRIDAFPTLILCDERGQIMGRFTGFVEAPALAQHLERVKATTLAARVEVQRRRAAQLLAQAQADFAAQMDLAAVQRCLAVVAEHAGTPEAAAAQSLLTKLYADPERLRTLQEALQRLQADLSIAQADELVRRGEPVQATAILEQALQSAGAGPASELLEAKLAQIKAPLR